MDNALFWLIAILVCHQIVTIWTYRNLLKEDRGVDASPKSKFSQFLQTTFLMLPFFLNCIYDCTLGLVDHFRERRLCKMLAERDDKIKELEKVNKKLLSALSTRKEYEASLLKLSNLDPHVYSYWSYMDLKKYTDDID